MSSLKRKNCVPVSEARDYFKEEAEYFICTIKALAPKVPGAEDNEENEETKEAEDAAPTLEICGTKIKKNHKNDGGKG